MGLAGSAKDSNNSRQRKRERNVLASPFFFPSIFLQGLSLTKPKRSPLSGEPGKTARTGQCPLIQNWAGEGGNRIWGSTGTNPTLKTLKLPLGKGGVNRLYFLQDGRFRKNRRETCGTSLRSHYLSMRYSWLRQLSGADLGRLGITWDVFFHSVIHTRVWLPERPRTQGPSLSINAQRKCPPNQETR